MSNLLKENTQIKIKRFLSTVFWCALSVLAYIIVDKIYLNDKPVVDTKIYSYEDVSTAINESHQLIITDRHTGLYKTYANDILVGIVGMESSYIAKDFKEKTTKPNSK